jgi:hypothetical protein
VPQNFLHQSQTFSWTALTAGHQKSFLAVDPQQPSTGSTLIQPYMLYAAATCYLMPCLRAPTLAGMHLHCFIWVLEYALTRSANQASALSWQCHKAEAYMYDSFGSIVHVMGIVPNKPPFPDRSVKSLQVAAMQDAWISSVRMFIPHYQKCSSTTAWHLAGVSGAKICYRTSRHVSTILTSKLPLLASSRRAFHPVCGPFAPLLIMCAGRQMLCIVHLHDFQLRE